MADDTESPTPKKVKPLPHRATDGPEEAEAVELEAAAHAEYVASHPEKSPLQALIDQVNDDALGVSEAQVTCQQMLAELDSLLSLDTPVSPPYMARVVSAFKARLEDEEIRASRLVSLAANVTV